MRKSRVLEKLRKNEPVFCTKTNIGSPWVIDTIGTGGYDCVWICLEHCPTGYDALENCIRAAKVYDMDIMVRVDKAGYPSIIKPLELDAAGIMYPHCMDAREAAEIVKTAKFHPIGRRPIDAGNLDCPFCEMPLKEYTAEANANRFLMVQIEDPEAVEHIDVITATEGIDVMFLGPADLSHGYGIPGETGDSRITGAIEKLAKACKKHGKPWGLPVTPATIRKYYDMGARFFPFGADVLALCEYFKGNMAAIRKELPQGPKTAAQHSMR